MSGIFSENYHSHFGALSESNHVYLQCGYCQSVAEPVRVLEMGLGTGLNALITAVESAKAKRPTHYVSVEKYPIPISQALDLNYSQLFENEYTGYFKQIHLSEWQEVTAIHPYFTFEKVQTDWLSYSTSDTFDVVYYDAFSPETQPELWTSDVFEKVYKMLNINAILVTYCAKGQVRRNLQSAGFKVERIAGPVSGKREILRAIKH
jgi:tRNA U34 5-methylaminomethyl-2-thiouridine-forming methyltransferase MnmC